MDLSNKRKYVKIDRETESDQIFAYLDEVNSDQEDEIDNVMNDSDTEFVLDEEKDKDVDSDDEPLSLLVPEANIHLVKKRTDEAVKDTAKDSEKGINKSSSKRKEKGKQKKEKPIEIDFNWKTKNNPHVRETCELKAEVFHEFPEHHSPFDVFSAVTNLDALLTLLVHQTNVYAQQKGRQFQTNREEMRAFLGLNYIMSINKLPTIKSYWECGQYIGNEGIRNVMARARFEEILSNLHFADNSKDDKSDKGYKVRTIINHFNDSFSSSLPYAHQCFENHHLKQNY